MGGAINPVSIAISLAIAGALPAVFISLAVATKSRGIAAGTRDATVSILFGISVLLIALYGVAMAFIAARGMAYVGLLKAALLLTALFAVAGTVLGLLRALRSSRPAKPQGA